MAKVIGRSFGLGEEGAIPAVPQDTVDTHIFHPNPAPAPAARNRGPMDALWGWITRRRREPGHGASPADLKRIRATLVECLSGSGGEVSARRRVEWLASQYQSLNDEGRQDLLSLLATEFGPNEAAVNRAIRDYLDLKPGADRRRAEQSLRVALASPRIKILSHFNLLHDGVKFLVDLRADVLRFRKALPELDVLDEELYSLFTSWFDVGFLELRRISWNSPAALLEKLIRYEAVHEIRSWNDLRNRLDSDRRCYAFFHPRMPDEPLVFVQVALVEDMASVVHDLLDETRPTSDPHDARAAIFYSISNTQVGLKGVSFGGFLIKRVVEHLCAELPKLKLFATLSPVPEFRRWLDEQLKTTGSALFAAPERSRLREASGVDEPAEALKSLLAAPEWPEHPKLRDALAPILTRLVAFYLAEAKENGRPVDSVARFHLGNGARLERINWLADTSPRGLRQSAGVMVNYHYKLDEIESNHEAFARHGKVPVGASVKRLLRAPE